MNLQQRIDVHAHYFPPVYKEMLIRNGITHLDGVPGPRWSEEIQMEYMRKLNITYAVLSISSPHLYISDKKEAMEVARGSNEYGAIIRKKYPGKFAIMASLPLPDTNASIEEIRYCREVLHVDGFALLTNSLGEYLGSPKLDPIMEELNREETVVVIHPTAPSVLAENVSGKLPIPVMEYFFDTTRAVTNMIVNGTIQKYQNIKFIVPHGGAFLTILSDRLNVLMSFLKSDKNLDVMGDLSRLYYDLAGISMPKQYRLLRMITEDTHILYGSDLPFTSVELCTKLSEKMDSILDGGMAEKIYRKNPLNLFPNAYK